MTIKTARLNLFLFSDDKQVDGLVYDVADVIGTSTSAQLKTLKLLLLNIFYYTDKKIAVSRKKQSMGPSRYNPYTIGYRPFLTVLDGLVNKGFIEQEKGYKDFKSNEAKLTLLSGTEELKYLFYRAEWSRKKISQINPETIRLKEYSEEGRSKKLIDYEESQISCSLRAEIELYSTLISNTDIQLYDETLDEYWQYEGEVIYRTFIKMSDNFHHTFNYGGRLYAPWASLSKRQRDLILINGNETVEHDFTASHVNTMYLMTTGQGYSQHEDPYQLIVKETLIPRHIVKKLSSILTNVKSVGGALEAIDRDYSILSKGAEQESKVSDYTQLYELMPAIVDAYLIKHHPVRDLFLKGKIAGNKIQCIESDIVMNIINYLTKLNIPVLTVFDSFIVEKEYEEILLELMKQAHYPQRIAIAA